MLRGWLIDWATSASQVILNRPFVVIVVIITAFIIVITVDNVIIIIYHSHYLDYYHI